MANAPCNADFPPCNQLSEDRNSLINSEIMIVFRPMSSANFTGVTQQVIKADGTDRLSARDTRYELDPALGDRQRDQNRTPARQLKTTTMKIRPAIAMSCNAITKVLITCLRS
jgi:hypothetical protein